MVSIQGCQDSRLTYKNQEQRRYKVRTDQNCYISCSCFITYHLTMNYVTDEALKPRRPLAVPQYTRPILNYLSTLLTPSQTGLAASGSVGRCILQRRSAPSLDR